MQKQNNLSWYQPMEAQYLTIADAMPLSKFARIEAVLYLLSQMELSADPDKAYLLFTEYHLIGITQGTEMDFILQRARRFLGFYRSQKLWQDDLNAYCEERYQAFRAFSIDSGKEKTTFSRSETACPYPFEMRKKEWERFWTTPPEPAPAMEYASDGRYHYTRLDQTTGESETVCVELKESVDSPSLPMPAEKPCRAPIRVSLEQLLEAAKQMSERLPGDPCYTILKSNLLREVSGSVVQESRCLTLREVINMVGMVGSGKSTLIKVLSFWCHQNGYRIAVVTDTVAEVFNLQHYLSSLDVSCSPLVGRNERLKYINQLAQPHESCLASAFSSYLTSSCLMDGMDRHAKEAITFGKEPCYRLKKGKKWYLCPWFDRCKGTKMLRDCYHASVVVTTVAGFAASRTGHNRETFLELAMRAFDLVIFDECDRVQKTLDTFFMPETSFDDYINECADECSAYMKLSSKRREENPAKQRYDELQRQSVTVLKCIIQSLRQDLGRWQRISTGDPFSAFTLLDDLFSEETAYQISGDLYHAIYRHLDSKTSDLPKDTLWAALQSSCKDSDETLFDQLYEAWMTGAGFARPPKPRIRHIQDNRIKLILKLIYFDHYIRGLRDAYEASHETSYGQNELFGFLQTRFRQQQFFLPSALCGNLFGLKKTDEEDIILFRQYAFGRSLMKDLPFLRLDEQGRPAGPHVLLLSGSSWAEGSYEYHVNRPVNYILEAASDKRLFLEKTRFFESGFLERVSGSAPEERVHQLLSVVKKSAKAIVQEYNRKAGKILLVVNSYAQAEAIQPGLEEALRQERCPAQVCRMIPDAVSTDIPKGTVRRGEVSRFASMDEEILIAPAMAIERGHNIVDEQGHSALGAVFFLVRPMAVPDDIQAKGSKLNGLIESQCVRGPGESVFQYNSRIRQLATQKWVQMNCQKAFGLAELAPDEQRDVVATLFVLILQIFGRLARITDTSKPEPHVWFMDGAFRPRLERPDDFDCLSALEQYLDELMSRKESAEIAQTLYAPFYKAFKGGFHHER